MKRVSRYAKFWCILLIFNCLSAMAQAESLMTFACGSGRDKGPLKSDIGIIYRVDDNIEDHISIYVNGIKIKANKDNLGSRGRDNLMMFWYRVDDIQQTLQFDIKTNSRTLVQRLYSDAESNFESKSDPIPCIITEK